MVDIKIRTQQTETTSVWCFLVRIVIYFELFAFVCLSRFRYGVPCFPMLDQWLVHEVLHLFRFISFSNVR